jgi:hypothetical protein
MVFFGLSLPRVIAGFHNRKFCFLRRVLTAPLLTEPISGLWLTWHHPAVRGMLRRAFRRLPHPAETQAAEMWSLFSLISVVLVFWLLDLTVVDLLPSSDPFTRYRFKPCRVPRKFHPAAHSSLVTLPRPAKV